jgi:HlyD family secretion protein
MDPVEVQADDNAVRTQSALRALQLRRIEAELSGRPLIRRSEDPADLFRQVSAQYHDRRQAHLAALQEAQASLSRSKHEFESGQEDLAKLEQTNPILKSQAASYAELGKDGYAPQVLVGDKRRAYLENEQDLRSQRAKVEITFLRLVVHTEGTVVAVSLLRKR